jgi:hypothetical protein
MSLKETNRKIKNLNIPEKDKDAFLELIDLKTNQDMKEVIAEMRNFKSELNTKLDTSIVSLKNENTFIKWLIGGIFAAITILLAIVAFKK